MKTIEEYNTIEEFKCGKCCQPKIAAQMITVSYCSKCWGKNYYDY